MEQTHGRNIARTAASGLVSIFVCVSAGDAAHNLPVQPPPSTSAPAHAIRLPPSAAIQPEPDATVLLPAPSWGEAPMKSPRAVRLPPVAAVTTGDSVQPASQIESLFPEAIAAPPANNSAAPEPASAYDYGGGLQWGFWGWVSYLRRPQTDTSTFWAYEVQLDVTKSFTERLAGTAEIDFMDMPGRETSVEQLFLSAVLPNHQETIFTAGKFNTPFGVEPRDFWDRVSASRSLLFRAQPQDVTGLMLTHRMANTNLVLRPMVINGFEGSGFDNNEQPSISLMTEYRPSADLSIAATNWWGPELDDEVGDKLYFFDAHLIWHLCPELSLAGEFLYGCTESPAGSLDWHGFLALVNYDLCNKLRVFLQWSLLDDDDAYLTGVAEQRQEVNAGIGWYLHPAVELRAEYRHDYRPVSGDHDHWDAHITFGY